MYHRWQWPVQHPVVKVAAKTLQGLTGIGLLPRAKTPYRCRPNLNSLYSTDRLLRYDDDDDYS
jgi:hypothetical protein